MNWINIKQYLPGSGISTDRILVRLSNNECHILGTRSLSGTWLASDGVTRCMVTHWLEITSPKDLEDGQ